MSIIICIGRYLLLCENKGVRSVCVWKTLIGSRVRIYIYIYIYGCVCLCKCVYGGGVDGRTMENRYLILIGIAF